MDDELWMTPHFFQFFSKKHHLSSWGLNRKLIPGILNVTCFSKISVAVCGLFDQRKWDDSTKTWWWFRSEAGITQQTWWTLTIWPTSMAGPPNLLRRSFGSPSSTRWGKNIPMNGHLNGKIQKTMFDDEVILQKCWFFTIKDIKGSFFSLLICCCGKSVKRSRNHLETWPYDPIMSPRCGLVVKCHRVPVGIQELWFPQKRHPSKISFFLA